MAIPRLDVNQLTTEERLSLLEETWDSLSHQPEQIPLTEAQLQDLDGRLDEVEAGDTGGIPWEEVLHQIRKSR